MWREHVQDTLRTYQDTIVPLIKHKGYRGVHPSVAWSPPAALMYSLSVYTTIGMYSLSVYTAIGMYSLSIYTAIGMYSLSVYTAIGMYSLSVYTAIGMYSLSVYTAIGMYSLSIYTTIDMYALSPPALAVVIKEPSCTGSGDQRTLLHRQW